MIVTMLYHALKNIRNTYAGDSIKTAACTDATLRRSTIVPATKSGTTRTAIDKKLSLGKGFKSLYAKKVYTNKPPRKDSPRNTKNATSESANTRVYITAR